MAVSTFKVRDRLIKHQPGRRRIPGSITPEEFLEITRILRRILEDMDSELRALQASRGEAYNDDDRPKELHIRLNETDKPFPLPVFAGWVESEDVRKTREEWNNPDPGLHRWGDDVYSEIYGEALNYANHLNPQLHFRYRDWAAGELLEKRAGEKATDPKAGNLFQTCLAIMVDDRAAGTLVVGFRRKPNQELLTKAQDLLREWAREDAKSVQRSALVDFLKKYEVGGPHLSDSNWWRSIP